MTTKPLTKRNPLECAYFKKIVPWLNLQVLTELKWQTRQILEKGLFQSGWMSNFEEIIMKDSIK